MRLPSALILRTALVASAAVVASGCGEAARKNDGRPTGASASDATLAGWYLQAGDRATLQPCGEGLRLALIQAAPLRQRAADAGMQPGNPIYVRLTGVRSAGEFKLTKVEQFGSPTPIRNCPMSGTMVQ